MAKSSKVNYTSRPVPSTPGSNQVTNSDLTYKKGGSEIKQKIPAGAVKGPGSKSSGC